MSDEAPKWLKIVVISGGVLLLAGFIFVAAVLVHRAIGETDNNQIADFKPIECQIISLPYLENAQVAIINNEWIQQNSREIRRYSLCGELVQTVKIEAKS